MGIVYVTHRLDEVFRIADRVTILRDGRKVATTMVSDTSPRSLVHAIVGRELEQRSPPPAPAQKPPILAVNGLVGDDVGPVSFTLMPGEIVSLVGLRGAGHDAVGRMLFGANPIKAGEILLGGRELSLAGPRAAAAAGTRFRLQQEA